MSTYSILAWTLLALLLAPLLLGVSLRAPGLIVLSMTAVLILFSSSTWGQLTVEHTIYSRGTGLFDFSLLNLVLFVAGVGLLLRRMANPWQPQLAPPISVYFFGFGGLLLAHLIAGAWIGVAIPEVLSYSGILNVLNMLIFMYLVVAAFRRDLEQRRLLRFIVLLAALRAVFGVVRFIWFDGDSANPYRNFERLDIKILFFDIADNFIASLTAFWAAWLLTSPEVRLTRLKQCALILLLLLEMAAVALSFRRASLLGLGLMFGFLLLRLPASRRLPLLMGGGAVLALSAVVFFQQRLQFSSHGAGSFFGSMVYDLAPAAGDKGAGEGRLFELLAAARSLRDNWVFGLGTWGKFTGDQQVLSYHFGRFDFVHSGLGHIVLKTGVVGLLLFCSMLAAWAVYYFKRCLQLRGNARLMSDIGFAGFLFWIPTLFIGTPIIEFRSMLLIGLALAMPFMATSLQRFQPASHVHP